jgi:hypothetical protein
LYTFYKKNEFSIIIKIVTCKVILRIYKSEGIFGGNKYHSIAYPTFIEKRVDVNDNK